MALGLPTWAVETGLNTTPITAAVTATQQQHRPAGGTHGEEGDKLLDFNEAPAEQMIAAPSQWCPNPAHTSCLRVKGPMAPTIPHDAIVAVDSSQTDHSQLDNKIVVAWDEKNGVSISRFRRYRGVEVLEPENRGYESVANVTNRTGSGRQDSSLTAEIAFRRLVGEAVQARNFLRITPRSPSAPLPKSTRLEGSGTGEDCEIVSLQPGGAAGPTQRRFRWKHPQLSEKYVPKPFTFLKVVKNPLKEGMVDAESLLQSLVTPAVPNKKHSVLPETTTVA